MSKVVTHNHHPHMVQPINRMEAQVLLAQASDGHLGEYERYWVADPGFAAGRLVLASGYKGDVVKASQRREIVAWYANGAFWTGYGTTLEKAVQGAQADAWKYMGR